MPPHTPGHYAPPELPPAPPYMPPLPPSLPPSVPPAMPPTPPVAPVWSSGLRATHFWDCNGGGCDATVLQPWNVSLYAYSPLYSPQDPAEHGGSLYGESLWLTGATSRGLGVLLGDDAPCCGRDDNDGEGVGGCGKCILVRNPSAVNSSMTAVVMKKSYCPYVPPDSNTPQCLHNAACCQLWRIDHALWLTTTCPQLRVPFPLQAQQQPVRGR